VELGVFLCPKLLEQQQVLVRNGAALGEIRKAERRKFLSHPSGAGTER
jgi:hypothetical protein